MMDEKALIAKNKAIRYEAGVVHPRLVTKLWALRGRCDKLTAENISEWSGLVLHWIDKAPSLNGMKGDKKLEAERGVLLLRNRTSKFIDQFTHPLGRCAKFYKLTAYNNCNFWCEYCYLYLTFRTNPVSTHFVNYDKMFKEILAFDRTDIPDALRVLNLGELSDPLAVEDVTGFAERLIPFVGEHARHTKLLFLTKSDNVDSLLDLPHGGRSIMSFSLNTDEIYRNLEHRTASPKARLVAAQKLQKAGYEVRFRIDPIILYQGWEDDYINLVRMMFKYVTPERITLGEYRPSTGLANHIRQRFPDSTLLKINESLTSDGVKLRYPERKRAHAFRTIIEEIRRHDPSVPVSLCKEDAAIWREAGLELNGLRCNCLG
ncbi:MAG: Spore photoproduct lyase [Syntrophorhabdus sp. PtaU1.Bin153]|nr:MAG: Spore photoproduct lyase [Syntrophorhabdus sp. PtaU1.Bin153]